MCGRRVAEFARRYPKRLVQTNPGKSPSCWRQRVGAPQPDRPSFEGRPPARGRGTQSALFSSLLEHQVRWKEEVAGVRELGVHNGRTGASLFPMKHWDLNLLPEFRADVVEHLRHYEIHRHEFIHHVMSSQVFALNLAAPFFRNPERLAPVLEDDVDRVLRVEAEVVGDQDYFGEPGTRGANRTSADLGIWARLKDGRVALTLVEVKFTERALGACSKGAERQGACDTDGPAIVASDGELCPLSWPPYRRRYWPLLRHLGVFRPEALEVPGPCPFRHGGYQLMRNQVLAAAIAADPLSGVDTARFVVLSHPGNTEIGVPDPPLGGSSRLEVGWPAMLCDPTRFGTLDARWWVETLGRDPALDGWAKAMLARYFPERVEQPAPAPADPGPA